MSPTKSSHNVTVFHIPLQHLEAAWQKIEPGLEESIEASHKLTTKDVVHQSLLNGQHMLWIALLDGHYAGFAITEILQHGDGFWVNFPFTWTDPSQAKKADVLTEGMKQIAGFAKSMGFSGVKFLSSRKGYERKARSMGFKKRFVEWILPFEEEE